MTWREQTLPWEAGKSLEKEAHTQQRPHRREAQNSRYRAFVHEAGKWSSPGCHEGRGAGSARHNHSTSGLHVFLSVWFGIKVCCGAWDGEINSEESRPIELFS